MKFQKGSMFSGRFRRLELLNMGIFDKMNQVSRNVAESSKSAAETSNLKKKIAYEKERIQEVMTEIGRLFYENPERRSSGRTEAVCRHRRQKASYCQACRAT